MFLENIPQNIFFRFIHDFISILYYPKEKMNYIMYKPKILIISILVVLSQPLLLIARYDIFSKYYKEKIQLLLHSEYKNLYSESQINSITSNAPTQALISIVISSLIIYLLTAFILFSTSKILKGKGNLKQYFCITAYSYSPIILGYIFIFFVSLFTNQLYFSNPLTSLGYILPDTINPFLKGAANAIEFFTLWKYLLLTFGLYKLSGLSKRKAICICGVLFLLILIISGINSYVASIY